MAGSVGSAIQELVVMKSKDWGRVAVAASLLVGLITIWISASPGQPPATKPGVVWEYKLHYAGNEDPLPSLNKWGLEGWELVTAYNTDPQRPVVYVFKRAK
jgi:hypothetical protein